MIIRRSPARVPLPARVSLRGRLLLISLALVAAGLVVSDLVVLDALNRRLTDRVDSQLHTMSALFSQLPPPTIDSTGSGEYVANIVVRTFDLVGAIYVADVSPDGQVSDVLASSAAKVQGGPRLPALDRGRLAARYGHPFDAGSQGGTRWRVLIAVRAPRVSVLAPSSAGGAAAATAQTSGTVVAISLSEVTATMARIRTICTLTGIAVLLVLAAGGWWATRAGLRPLRRIEETAAAIAGGDLSGRVPDLAAPGTEIGRLSVALNGMLAQIEDAFTARAESERRMRRFVADVSHELRTPLFGIKGFTELYRMGGLPERADVDRTMTRIEEESTRLARLTEDLLLLARLDEPGGGALPLELAPMDLRTLAADARQDLRALDPSRPVEVIGPDGGPPEVAAVLADEARLRQVVTNLVGNVIAHTPAGTPVRIRVGTLDGARALLAVEDDGPGLPPNQAERVFDRFYRADRSRARGGGGGGGGAGLGLSVVRSLVLAHGGQVEVRTATGAGAAFRITFPAIPDDPSGDQGIPGDQGTPGDQE